MRKRRSVLFKGCAAVVDNFIFAMGAAPPIASISPSGGNWAILTPGLCHFVRYLGVATGKMHTNSLKLSCIV